MKASKSLGFRNVLKEREFRKISKSFIFCLLGVMSLGFSSCSKDSASYPDEPDPVVPDTPSVPEVPSEPGEPVVKNDTVEVRFTYKLDVKVEDLYPSRAEIGGGKDLIGVNVNKGTEMATGWRAGYAAAVFDDVSKMVFKLVKGQTYHFSVRYVPNAKDYVYNYPDGSFGLPFRNTLHDIYNVYLPNEIIYDNGFTQGGYSGPWLCGMMDPMYQMGSGNNTNDRTYLNIPYYYGYKTVTIDENSTDIEVELNLCQIGITLNVNNFNEGKLRLVMAMCSGETYTFEPGGENKLVLACGAYEDDKRYVDTDMKLYYDSPEGKSYLIGSTLLRYTYGKNYVFDFDLAKQEDGSVSMVIPETKELEDEHKTFE